MGEVTRCFAHRSGLRGLPRPALLASTGWFQAPGRFLRDRLGRGCRGRRIAARKRRDGRSRRRGCQRSGGRGDRGATFGTIQPGGATVAAARPADAGCAASILCFAITVPDSFPAIVAGFAAIRAVAERRRAAGDRRWGLVAVTAAVPATAAGRRRLRASTPQQQTHRRDHDPKNQPSHGHSFPRRFGRVVCGQPSIMTMQRCPLFCRAANAIRGGTADFRAIRRPDLPGTAVRQSLPAGRSLKAAPHLV